MDLFSTNECEKGISLEYTGVTGGDRIPKRENIEVVYLKGDGDFRSKECIELLKQTDIVVTNPPFSLFREYVEQLMKYKKKFLIIGTWNAVAYKEIFKLLMKNDVWIGFNATILKGVHIGAGAIIQPGALVIENVEPGAIVSGNPAKKVSIHKFDSL